MGSRRAADARPVLRQPSSCLRAPSAPSMRRFTSARSLVPDMADLYYSAASSGCYQRTALLAAEDRRDRTRPVDREDDYRQACLAGKRKGRSVHHLQVTADDLVMRQVVVTGRRGI